MNREIQWTEEREDKLRKLWPNKSLSCADIGAILGGITKSAVSGKVSRMGLPRRDNPSKERKFDGDRVPGRIARVRTPRDTLPALASETFAPLVAIKPVFAKPPQIKVVVPFGRVKECCTIIGEGRPWLACSKPTIPGKDYCPECHALFFRKPPERRRHQDAP